ncbi:MULTISPECIES: methyltransferase domain-containing protein [unclassified Streptomyces]|uniref:class I SAM-dependent methyltransferase n=1 Tax=unclassified Streptomyces TaxID=2593676 RepID=UPI002E153057|nr:class I SAM-dependent methyltransferase [Streptomyces sp. NBC_01197]WSS47730.1 class I SAM-dependent methyltransferase [Streptomyces sp. NBC_01180]
MTWVGSSSVWSQGVGVCDAFADDAFDVVTANFVLDHVGWPQRALVELGRVSRPGGRIAVTVWSVPTGAGQALLGRAMEAAGVERPVHRPVLAPETDFARTEQGLVDLLLAAGLSGPTCRTIAWNHRASAQEWWHGAAAGVGFTASPPSRLAPERRSSGISICSARSSPVRTEGSHCRTGHCSPPEQPKQPIPADKTRSDRR